MKQANLAFLSTNLLMKVPSHPSLCVSSWPYLHLFIFIDADTEIDEDVTTWLSPQIIDSISRVSLVACGQDHTLALVEREYIPIQFTKDGNAEDLYMWLENNSKLRDLDDAAFKAAVESIRSS
jgi:hypothetical protein